jgi:hypothetical protein
MTQDILKTAIEKLANYKEEINEKIKTYEAEMIKYGESNKELLDEMAIEVINPEIDKEIQKLQNCEQYRKDINGVLDRLGLEIVKIKDILNYNVDFGDLDKFFSMVLEINGYDASNVLEYSSIISKQVMVPVPLKKDDLRKFNELRVDALLRADTAKNEKFFYNSNNKREVAIKIKQLLNSPAINAFFTKFGKFLMDSLKVVDDVAKEAGERIQELRDQEIKRRKDEIKNNLAELIGKIEECKKSLKSIDEIYELYGEYNKTQDRDVLIRLISQLADLAIIGQRESKLAIYEQKEEEETSEEKKEEPKEEKKILEKVEEKTLENPLYFKDPNTQNIICFLGKDDDNIFTDMTDHFDNSNIPYVESELVSIFNILYAKGDYENKTGGNPKYFSSTKVRAYREKLGYKYLRFGVSQAQYRIHAITRDSKLLKQLGYGTGRLTFFGALGVNDDNEKTGAYDRIARRGIAEMGNPPKLQPSFDYIEHITRSYIPSDLLSDADKEKIRLGKFTGNIKGTDIKKSLPYYKYIYYDILDDDSKENVKKWLDMYFTKQSDKMFEVINKHNERKKKKND